MPIPSDEALLASCQDFARERARLGNRWLFLETAGGVHSPTPSGTTQADLYMPLRIPVVLIGDSRLGGISQTISAFESLRIRGYDVESVLLFDSKRYGNREYLFSFFREKHGAVQVESVSEPPPKQRTDDRDAEVMMRYYDDRHRDEATHRVLRHLDQRHERRIERLEDMASQAHRRIWYPFTQQHLLKKDRINVIDSAHGDYFQTLIPQEQDPCATPSAPGRGDAGASDIDKQSLLQASFDGSASWWTQGLGHSNPQLTLAAGYAAGRYGHVMFAESIHEPALALAETLIKGLGNPRLSRVFFSDNGSTGIEVALKMALRATRVRYYGGETDESIASEKLGVIGLRNGYHGDTLGAMDCAEPCAFNQKTEWYTGRGFWFDYPTVVFTRGRWRLVMGEELHHEIGRDQQFDSLDDIFDLERREAEGQHHVYERFIRSTLEKLHEEGRRFGALILEPIVLGAGGMALVDPLFQRALVNVTRRSTDVLAARPETRAKASMDGAHDWSGLPVIFDEVFTGLYRLGRFSSASFLGAQPDISVHAKLLTGGLVPLCTTVASESIFKAFGGNDKTDALLHGHSYTAHPIGCQVAVESLRQLMAMEQSGQWDWAKDNGTIWSVWPRSLVVGLASNAKRVSGVWALGSVLSVHLRDETGTGYSSNAAMRLRDSLILGDSSALWNVHCRSLGNVLYLMASQTTTPATIERIERLLDQCMKA